MLVDRLTSGMVGAEVEFRFSTEWEQLIKTAVFIAGSEKRVVLEAEWRDNICTIPHECLAAPDVHLLAGVYGTTPDGSLVIPTVYADLGMIWTGTDPNGESGAEASPELWAQLQAQVNLMESSANKVSSISEASTDEQYPSARAVYEALAADNGGSVVIEGTVSADMSEVTISTLDAWAKVSEAWNDAKHPPVVLRLSDEVCAYLTSVSSMEDFNGQSMGVALFSFPPAYMLNSAPPYSIWLFENNEAVILNTLERIMSDVSTAGVQNKVIKKYVDDTAAGLQTALGGYQPAGDYALRSELFGGSYNDLTDRPEIPEAVTEQTVAGWGFTKNTGTYSKPSSGIPRADLAADVQTSLGKADTALQSHQSLAGYATESWVTAKGYQTADQVQSAIDAAVGDIDALIGSGGDSMSLKSKLQSLIAAANAKTGKSAADLTAAVQDLIDGFGGTVQINFSIYDETIGFSLGTFSVAAGTTFREWTGPDGINAGRRIFCTGSDQSGAVLVGEGDCSLRYNGAAVHGTDEIISEATYTVVSDY